MKRKDQMQAMTEMRNALGRKTPERVTREFQTLQASIYVMAGGSWLGRSLAESPANGYIDSRIGALPYGRKKLEQAVQALCIYAEVLGLDPHGLPEVPTYLTIEAFAPLASTTEGA